MSATIPGTGPRIVPDQQASLFVTQTAAFVTRQAGVDLTMPNRLLPNGIEFAPAGPYQRPLPQILQFGDAPIKEGSSFAVIPIDPNRPSRAGLQASGRTDFASERNFLQQIALKTEMETAGSAGELELQRLMNSGASYLKIARICTEGDEPLSAVHAFFRAGVAFAMMKGTSYFVQAEQALLGASKLLFKMNYYAASAVSAEMAADVRDVVEARANPKKSHIPPPESFFPRAYAAAAWTNALLNPLEGENSEIVFRGLHNAWRSDHKAMHSSRLMNYLSDRLAQAGRFAEAAEHMLRLGLMYAMQQDLTTDDLMGASDSMQKAGELLERSGSRPDIAKRARGLGRFARTMAE